MMNGVAAGIAILRDISRGSDIERKAQAALMTFAARLHAHLHDALAHGGLVAECSDVTDGINHLDQGRLYGIIKINLVNGAVRVAALIANVIDECSSA